ncbi:MAG: hypothetical protein A2087_14225 [Spirochaetes bacterium GWD1_61_31]|nr:MAG: hypothetical protein A2Y37_04110 [Spirochaetes bacterium GWB1_60_80]OHD30566.1 MAG: hypothetical protein A2004_05500 [Spirochaetes bacterium GWC1_61_12]OHD34834.1 MAG: hypothetical protein A2087_14225 [Spirochaetes bacterium GWD1_61_31]OHD46680.1 MAG: hypothetical protein A2Y35_11050 [Spirochaetes bacterium GWE1_60_18]HAP44205.1 hypothetical protein [Spirochaetaceae bacterium]
MSAEGAAGQPLQACRNPDFDVVVRSRVALERNLAAFPYPGRLSDADRAAAQTALEPALLAGGLQPWRVGELPPERRAALVDRELVPRAYLVDEDRYLALHADKPVWALFMQHEHISLMAQYHGLALTEGCALLFAIDDAMNSLAPWAFDHDFGYLSSRVDHLGSGLSASLALHLPALELGGFIEVALKQAMDAGFRLGGLYGGGRGPAGSLYELSLPPLFGESEATALERLRRAAGALAAYERSSRQELLERSPWEILDVIGRAAGKARMAHTVSWDESADIVSGIRLGVATGVLAGLDLAAVTELWYSVRRAVGDERRPDYAARAELLRRRTASLVFTEREADV